MTRSKITIQTTISCSKDIAWACWNLPQHIVHWNFASDDWHCPHATNDLKVGGKYCARMEAKDKSFGFDFEATYTEIETGKKLVYVIGDGRTVVTTFEAKEGDVTITTTFEAEDIFPEEMQRDGWQAILDNFKKYVVSLENHTI